MVYSCGIRVDTKDYEVEYFVDVKGILQIEEL